MMYPSCSTSGRCRHVMGLALLLANCIITLKWSNVVVGLAIASDTETEHREHNYISNSLVASSSLSTAASISSFLAVNNDVSIWPFSHHDTNNSSSNSNSTGNQTSDDTNNNKDKVCNDATTCNRCNSYYTCHWCAHDSTCHAIGSVYGCMIGSSCNNKKTKPSPNIDPNDTATGCSSHTSCRDCTLSSHLCHWCGHDNMCHAVGSLYGCVTGVDCYDNLHCQRTVPEPITNHHHSHNHSNPNDNSRHTDVPIYHRNIGILPLVLILSLSGIMMCCSTSCCCIMNCLKGAYDDLAVVTMISPSNWNHDGNDLDEQRRPFISDLPSSTSHQSAGDDNFFDCHTSPDTCTTTTVSAQPLVSNQTDEIVLGDEQTEPLLETTTTTNEDCYIRMVDGQEETNDSSPTTTTNNDNTSTPSTLRNQTTTRPRQHRRFVAMQRLYITCMGCYVCTILFVGFCTYLTIYYFPQKPIYNICNDSVAWKSLMDSMTSFTATAEFQILASVYNPNPLDVALDVGKGSFAHNGDTVGTYEIPPTLIASQAITDLLIVARFTPEKWQALSITAEYYSGNLVLHVNADASIRIPALFDYTISTSLQDIVVHVNALSDRHLCSCPTWSNNNVSSYHPRKDNPFEL